MCELISWRLIIQLSQIVGIKMSTTFQWYCKHPSRNILYPLILHTSITHLRNHFKGVINIVDTHIHSYLLMFKIDKSTLQLCEVELQTIHITSRQSNYQQVCPLVTTLWLWDLTSWHMILWLIFSDMAVNMNNSTLYLCQIDLETILIPSRKSNYKMVCTLVTTLYLGDLKSGHMLFGAISSHIAVDMNNSKLYLCKIDLETIQIPSCKFTHKMVWTLVTTLWL